MALHIEKDGKVMWCVKQVRNGIPIDFYYGFTLEEAISKAVNDPKYSDDEKVKVEKEAEIKEKYRLI